MFFPKTVLYNHCFHLPLAPSEIQNNYSTKFCPAMISKMYSGHAMRKWRNTYSRTLLILGDSWFIWTPGQNVFFPQWPYRRGFHLQNGKRTVVRLVLIFVLKRYWNALIWKLYNILNGVKGCQGVVFPLVCLRRKKKRRIFLENDKAVNLILLIKPFVWRRDL